MDWLQEFDRNPFIYNRISRLIVLNLISPFILLLVMGLMQQNIIVIDGKLDILVDSLDRNTSGLIYKIVERFSESFLFIF